MMLPTQRMPGALLALVCPVACATTVHNGPCLP
eukprot:COSAG02_NODE_42913_length_380_cov_0.519573_1_plen_32_part_01